MEKGSLKKDRNSIINSKNKAYSLDCSTFKFTMNLNNHSIN